MKILKESGNPKQMSLADLLSVITKLRISILSIDKRISNPSNLLPPDYFDKIIRKFSRKTIHPEVYFMFEKYVEELREILYRFRKMHHMKMMDKLQIEFMELYEKLEIVYSRLKETSMVIREMM